jgi:Icc-related predicted phosphoesterase
MVFLYVTDLHGDTVKYNSILRFAIKKKISLVHLGGDLLPKGSGLSTLQEKFVKKFLKEYYATAAVNNIKLIGFFGNDDLPSKKKYFLQYASLLDETPEVIDGYNFVAYAFVPDYPFGLKDSCKLEYAGWARPFCTRPVIDNNGRIEDIEDADEYFIKKGTIREDLLKFLVAKKAIVAFHCPPAGGDLDICFDRRAIGSVSILQWIEKNQPILVLCGHIHESPDVSGIKEIKIGNSLVVQPGDNCFVRMEVNDTVKTEYISFS